MMIPCEFRKIPEFNISLEKYQSNLKCGRYHNSFFSNVEDDRYVVACYIDFDYKKWIGSNLGEEEIIKQCVEHLNELVTPRKSKNKKLKRDLKPFYRYGFLKPYDCKIVKDKEDKFYIIALLTTDNSECKYFWGESKEVSKNVTSFSRRGRPKKRK